MNLNTLSSFADELEKIAVSDKWIREHARRGHLQRMSRWSINSPGGLHRHRSGKKRPERSYTDRMLDKPHSDRFFRQMGAKLDGDLDGLRDWVRGERLKPPGKTFTQKHWKKGLGAAIAIPAVIAAGAGIRHLAKKKKAES